MICNGSRPGNWCSSSILSSLVSVYAGSEADEDEGKEPILKPATQSTKNKSTVLTSTSSSSKLKWSTDQSYAITKTSKRKIGRPTMARPKRIPSFYARFFCLRSSFECNEFILAQRPSFASLVKPGNDR